MLNRVRGGTGPFGWESCEGQVYVHGTITKTRKPSHRLWAMQHICVVVEWSGMPIAMFTVNQCLVCLIAGVRIFTEAEENAVSELECITDDDPPGNLRPHADPPLQHDTSSPANSSPTKVPPPKTREPESEILADGTCEQNNDSKHSQAPNQDENSANSPEKESIESRQTKETGKYEEAHEGKAEVSASPDGHLI